MSKPYLVIMAGGRGERFWPESRAQRPKQLLPIVGEVPMLQQTVERLDGLVDADHIFVITNLEQRAATLEVCPQLDPAKVIGEPVGRDTAAAVGLATLLVRREDPDAVFAMLPADAVIQNAAALRATLQAAFQAAAQSPALVTIGIQAQHPATGYGYIQQGPVVDKFAGYQLYQVERFVEKPDLETAESYLNSGDYFWNAGMFIWSVEAIATELAARTPDLWKSLQAIEIELAQGGVLDRLMAKYYPKLEKISIDYAVIEKAQSVVMLQADFDWDDVGEWPAIARHYPADPENNVVRGTVALQTAKGNIVYTRNQEHLVALVGVDDLIVVQTEDATLVCHKEHAQTIKALVQKIGAQASLKKFT